jgi:hypothetical protein
MVYQHHRNGLCYEIVDRNGFDATLDREIVVYRPLYPSKYRSFTRTPEDFFGEVSPGVPRFAEVPRFGEVP